MSLLKWRFYKEITLSNVEAGQHLFKIAESPGASGYDFHLDGKSLKFPSGKNDSGDVRLTSKDGKTIYPIWVENVEGTAPNRVAYVWVNIPNDANNLTIKCWFGNPNAENVSNGDETFELFSDWNTGTFENWNINNINDKANAVLVDDDWIKLYAPDANNRINIYRSFYCEGSMIIRIKGYKDNNYDGWIFGFGDGTISNSNNDFWKYGYAFAFARDVNSYNEIIKVNNGNLNKISTTSYKFSSNTIYILEGSWKNSDFNFTILNDGVTLSAQDSSYSSENFIQIGNAIDNLFIDWITVRKYTTSEPQILNISNLRHKESTLFSLSFLT